MSKDRTFVITATKDIRADDVDITANDRVAMITGLVSPTTLFGLLQFHRFSVEEVPVDDASEAAAEAEAADETEAAAEAGDSQAPAAESSTAPAATEAIDASYPSETPSNPVVAQFIADGLDEKIAHVLVEQNQLDPDGVRKLIDEGYDLVELEGIGTARAEKILAIYGPKP